MLYTFKRHKVLSLQGINKMLYNFNRNEIQILYVIHKLRINKFLPRNHVKHNKSHTNFYAKHVTYSAIVQSECHCSVNEDDHKFRIEQLNKASSILARKSDWLLQQATAQNTTVQQHHRAQQPAAAQQELHAPKKQQSEGCHGAGCAAQQSSKS